MMDHRAGLVLNNHLPVEYEDTSFLHSSMPNMVHRSLLISLALTLVSFTTALSEGQFVYSSGFSRANLMLDGAATVTKDGVLELTNQTVNKKGHAFYPTPWQFRKSPGEPVQSFSVNIVIGMVPLFSNECTDGMTFLISPTKDFSGAQDSQYLGLLNKTSDGKRSNHIFAVEFDSSKNTEFNDIDDNHVGIDINSLTSFRSKSAGFYDDSKNDVFENLSLVSQEAIQAWVDYSAEAIQINVTLAPVRAAKPSKPLLSAVYNLSTVLEDTSYIGFSASTGPINSIYCVLGWSFGLNSPAPMMETTKLPKLPHFGSKSKTKLLEIILPISTAIAVLLAGTAIILLIRRRMRFAEIHEDWEAEFGPYHFPFKDLFLATDGFKNKNLLGQGGFGKVYKGVLPVSKLDVAVKKVSHESKQGIKEFVAEVVSIGRLRHRNLVQLLGYCRRKGELLLVYDYMSNGSLDKYIHGREDKPTLDWSQRFKIMKGIACGLFYLHERWEKVVIHRDVKASNVLLDSELNGRLGDFGLARLYDHGTNPETTHVVGTMGYIAPELGLTGKATPQTDVYAFGIFVLEVTCGQRPLSCPAEEDGSHMLIDWVVEHWRKGSLTDTLDSRLHSNYDAGEVRLALNLGLLCAHPVCSARPSMRQVVTYLNGEAPLPEMVPTELSYSMLALMQNQGFDQYASLPSTVGVTSSLSVGR